MLHVYRLVAIRKHHLTKRRISTTTAFPLLLGSAALSGCAPLECFKKKPPDIEAFELVVGNRLRPVGTWNEDRELEDFLRNALKTQSATTVAARYGLQCMPRDQAIGCSDCFTCRGSVWQWRLGGMSIPLPVLALKCVDYGEVLVQAEIGPQSSVRAMTYWKTSPEAREDLARPGAAR